MKLKSTSCIRTQSVTVKFNTEKRVEAEENGEKVGKSLYKLMNNAAYGKLIENIEKYIRLLSSKEDKLDIKIELHAIKTIWQWFSCNK